MNAIATDGPSLNRPRLNRREFVIGGALLGTGLVTTVVSHQLDAAKAATSRPLEELVPDAVGPWVRSLEAAVLIPKGDVGEGVYDNVVTPYFTSPAAPPVMLLIAYSGAQTGTTQLHRPEICYPSAGFRMREQGTRLLQLPGRMALHVKALSATAPGRVEQILYWSRVGSEFPTNTSGQRLAMLRSTLGGAVPDGALVRMSMIHPEPATALKGLAAFGRALVEAASPDLRRLLVGEP